MKFSSAGFLKGLEYIDRRDDIQLQQERQRRLDEMNRQKFDQSMQVQALQLQQIQTQMKRENLKQLMPFYAQQYKAGVLFDDIGQLQQVHDGLGVAQMTGIDVLQEVTEADRDELRKQGIITGPLDQDISKRFVKSQIRDKQGNLKTKFLDKSLYAASLGLDKYWSDKEQKELIEKLSLQKKVAEVGKLGAEAKKLTQEAKVKEQAMGIQEFINTQGIEFIDTLDKDTIKGKTKIGDREVSNMQIAKEVQGKAVPKDLNVTTNIGATYNSFKQIKEDVEKSDVKWGAPEKISTEVTRVFGGSLTNLINNPNSDADKLREGVQEALQSPELKRIGLDTRVMTALAKYIKDMSGAAVTNEEREFYKKLATGGTWSTKETFITAVEGFMTGLKTSYDNTVESYKSVYPYTYGQLVGDLDAPEQVKPKASDFWK